MDTDLEKMHSDWLTRKTDEKIHDKFVPYRDKKIAVTFEEGSKILLTQSYDRVAYISNIISEVKMYEENRISERDKLMATVQNNECYQVLNSELASLNGESNDARSSGKEIKGKNSSSQKSNTASDQ